MNVIKLRALLNLADKIANIIIFDCVLICVGFFLARPSYYQAVILWACLPASIAMVYYAVASFLTYKFLKESE